MEECWELQVFQFLEMYLKMQIRNDSFSFSKEFANSPSDKEESMEIHTSKFCKGCGEEEEERDFNCTNI